MVAGRGLYVWLGGVLLVLVPFLVFVAVGWPGEPDCCIYPDSARPPHCGPSDPSEPRAHSCYCEDFTQSDVTSHKAGVRQPVNTWGNLYALVTALIVALQLYFDRSARQGGNVMKSSSAIADLYVFAVLFLGLGSMWFHASLVTWAGNLDGLSMYVYATFLVFYTVRRLWDSDLFFWLAYLGTVALYTVVHVLWRWELKSLVLIVSLVAAYLTLEVIVWCKTGKVLQGKTRPRVLWSLAVVCIVVATVSWILSQTGKPLCDGPSSFQPHGLLWHPLAGVMAVLLYYYWRDADDRPG